MPIVLVRVGRALVPPAECPTPPPSPVPARRRVARLACGLLAGLVGPGGAGGCARLRAATAPAAGAPVRVADGVYVVPGGADETDSAHLGRVGNAGFIVGEAGVIGIDTGTSYRQGAALLDAIARVTSRPVRLVLLTHARQEFVFGAAAYRERGIAVHMHRDAAALMAARCQTCLQTLRRSLGEHEMQGTALIAPDHPFEHAHRLELVGRPVRVLQYGHSSGPGDIAVLDERSGVLFAGGLVTHERIPDVQDGDPAGWQQALAALRALRARAVVPGRGAVAPPSSIDATGRYLTALQARVGALVDAGVGLAQAPDRAELAQFAHWQGYPSLHRRNVSVVFLRLEREQLFR